MSPARGKVDYTEQDDKSLQDAIDKQTRQGKRDEVERSIGATVRDAKKGNA